MVQPLLTPSLLWPQSKLTKDINHVLGFLHRIVVGDAADVSEARNASILRVELRRLMSLCLYITFCFEREQETSATSLTTTRCNNPTTGLTSVINHRESLK